MEILFGILMSFGISFLSVTCIGNLVAFITSFKYIRGLIRLNRHLKDNCNIAIATHNDKSEPTILRANDIEFKCNKRGHVVIVHDIGYEHIGQGVNIYVPAYFDSVRPTEHIGDKIIHYYLFSFTMVLVYLLERRPRKVYNTFNDVLNL